MVELWLHIVCIMEAVRRIQFAIDPPDPRQIHKVYQIGKI